MTSSWSKERFKSDKILKNFEKFWEIFDIFMGNFLIAWKIFSFFGKFEKILQFFKNFAFFWKIWKKFAFLRIWINFAFLKILHFLEKKFFQNFAMFKMLCTLVLW